MIKVLSLVTVVVLLFGSVIAQVTKQVAPTSYPPAARAVRATGKIGVSVNVDPEGKVVTAEAFLGHPLLRAVSVSASKEWLFEPISPDTRERNFLLFFNYLVGSDEVTIIDESEKELTATFSMNSITPLEIDLVSLIQIPRFLKLPRNNGKLQDEFCPIHKGKLSIEVQLVDCSGSNPLYDEKTKYWDIDGYYEAETEQFPKSMIFVGCRSNGVERMEVRYCEKCRQERTDWIVRNGV